jgi:hypothetical protein
LIAALADRQQLAADIADSGSRQHRDDFQAVLDAGDREKLLALLTDLPAELRQLDFIRTAAAAEAPQLPPGLALLLWREFTSSPGPALPGRPPPRTLMAPRPSASRFSMVWKKVFHAMEKLPERFPCHGKIRLKFSTPWKTFFHSMENRSAA